MFVTVIDLLAIASFAISGTLAGWRKRLDPFGILIIAFVTSIGGGTLRDLLLGRTPVGWMDNMAYVYVILICVVLSLIFRPWLSRARRGLFLFDTIGLGLYTISGVEIAVQTGLNPILCVAIGTISACFGGVIRDVLVTEVPVIFRKNIYATACILGAMSYFVLRELPIEEELVSLLAILNVIIIRTSAVVFKLRLPSLYSEEEQKNDALLKPILKSKKKKKKGSKKRRKEKMKHQKP